MNRLYGHLQTFDYHITFSSSLLGTWDNGHNNMTCKCQTVWLWNWLIATCKSQVFQLAPHRLVYKYLYCELWWHFPDFQKVFVAALISSQNNLDLSASFCYNRKAKKRRKTKKANFTSFSWLGKKWEAQIEQQSKISKSPCELGKTCNYSLWPNLESMVGLWKVTS